MQGVPLLVTPQDALEKRPRDPAIYQDFDTGRIIERGRKLL